jgi:hypothetical protein
MKRVGLFLVAILTIALMSGSAVAQGDQSYFFVTYYSNNVSGAPDGTLRFINDGDISADIYAQIYVFDDSQEMQECGACTITPDGLLSEDVKTELTSNTLTGKVPPRGVIKVFAYAAAPGLHGWATHIERATPTSGAYVTTEAPLADSNVSLEEYINLENLCKYLLDLGSGQGSITCTPEDNDF